MIEIIDGVKVDWSLYKATKNKNSERAFINFCSQVQKINGKILGKYTGKEELLDILIGDVVVTTTPTKFRTKTLASIKKFEKELNSHKNHKFMKWSSFKCGSGGGLIVQLKVESNGESDYIEVPLGAYNYGNGGFLKSEKETYDYIKENNFKALTPYVRNKEKMLVDFGCGHKANWITPDNLKKGVGCPKCADILNSGENNCNWKGGVSPLNSWLRDRIVNWKRDTLKKYDYKCTITKSKKNLAIHHLKSFSEIVDEMIKILNIPIYKTIGEYSEEELNQMEVLILELHYKYGLGVVITKELHDEFHKSYGYGDNTPEQFNEFKKIKQQGLNKVS